MTEKMEIKNTAVFAARVLQILSIASAVVGFIWASSDFLLTVVLKDAPVTPLSVLLMLYGAVGTFAMEGVVRYLKHSFQN